MLRTVILAYYINTLFSAKLITSIIIFFTFACLKKIVSIREKKGFKYSEHNSK